MKTLAFDISTKMLSIALFDKHGIKDEFHEDVGIAHSELLIPTIKAMLERSGWRIEDIGLAAVGIGPGSFTGLRIAVATVKGLSAGTGIRAVGVPSMDAMAMCLPGVLEKDVAPLLDARKGKVYSCKYDMSGKAPERISGYMLLTVNELLDGLERDTVFFGDGVKKYRSELDKHGLADYIEDIDWYPRATWIGKMGIEKYNESSADPDLIEPLYLHAKECNITQGKG